MTKEILHCWVFWAGPMLIVITIFGWQKPITDLPPQMPVLFRIIGITGGLLMCIGCFLRFGGRNTIDQIAYLGAGIFGIGIAGWFWLGFTQRRAPVFCAVGISQAAWMSSLLCWNLISEIPRDRRAIRRQISAELKKIFPARDLYLAAVSAWACGLCGLACVTLFVWLILVTNAATYFTQTRPLTRAAIWCLLATSAWVPFALLTNLTKAAFVKKPNPRRGDLRAFALGCGFVGILICLLAAGHGGDKAGWVIGSATCPLWAGICWLWYKHSLKIAGKAKESDYHKRIRGIAADESEASFDALGSRAFVSEVVTTDEGLKVANVAAQALYRWEDIKYIQLYHNGNSAAVVNKQQRFGIGQLSVSEGLKNQSEQMEHIWAKWLDKIERREDIREFEYPTWSQQRDAQELRSGGVKMVICGIVICGIGFLPFAENKDGEGSVLAARVIFFLLGLLVLGLAGYFFRASRKKKLHSLRVRERQMTIYYDDGSTACYDTEDIREYRYGAYSQGVEITFKDGTRLKNLDRVSYWPVLRERLQTCLQQRPAKLS